MFPYFLSACCYAGLRQEQDIHLKYMYGFFLLQGADLVLLEKELQGSLFHFHMKISM